MTPFNRIFHNSEGGERESLVPSQVYRLSEGFLFGFLFRFAIYNYPRHCSRRLQSGLLPVGAASAQIFRGYLDSRGIIIGKRIVDVVRSRRGVKF